MAYIGKTPVIGNFQKCDSIAVVNGQAAYTLQVGGTNVSPQSENHMLVSLNGILQAPVDSFTVSGSTLTFASNLVTGDVIDFVMILGNVLDLGVPSDNTVSLAKLTATGTKDATTFLRGDNTFAEAGGGIEVADQWRLSASITGTNADITSNLERVDSTGWGGIGTGVTESSGIFSFPSTGVYLINVNASFFNPYTTSTVDGLCNVDVYVTTDNSSYTKVARAYGGFDDTNNDRTSSGSTSFILDVTDISNVKIKFATSTLNSDTALQGSTSENRTDFLFIRLGDT